jgi:hypothetical protein
MSIVQLQKRIFLRDHIKGMSHENLHKYAAENPLIPTQALIAGMSENLGHAATVQNYCQLVNAQIDIQLPDIASLASSQAAARANAGYWLDTLNPLIIRVYTQVKQFCNFYSAFTEAELEALVDDIGNKSGGTKTFIAVMNAFKSDTDTNWRAVNDTAQKLVVFSGELSTDLRNFLAIKEEADNKYMGSDKLLAQLQSDMISLERKVKLLNIAIGVLSAAAAVGVLMVVIGTLFAPATAGKLATADIALVGGAATPIKKLIDNRNKDQGQYRDKAAEFDSLEKHCAVLQKLANDFESLATSNELAGIAVQQMVGAWQTMGENFAGITESVEAIGGLPLDKNLAILIKKRLTSALEDVGDLKKFAEDCERNGILPVSVEDTKLAHDLHLPNCWIKKPVDGQVFKAFIDAKRRSGLYGGGRRVAA